MTGKSDRIMVRIHAIQTAYSVGMNIHQNSFPSHVDAHGMGTSLMIQGDKANRWSYAVVVYSLWGSVGPTAIMATLCTNSIVRLS